MGGAVITANGIIGTSSGDANPGNCSSLVTNVTKEN